MTNNIMNSSHLVFIKLGGSIITNKNETSSLEMSILERLVQEIDRARLVNNEMQLVIGLGAGSFGHTVASNLGFSVHERTTDDSYKVSRIASVARDFLQIVSKHFEKSRFSHMSFQTSAFSVSNDNIIEMNTIPIQICLQTGVTPLVSGDLISSKTGGWVLASTEQIFMALVQHLKPDRIIIVGKEDGIYRDLQSNERIVISEITSENIEYVTKVVEGSQGVDVTGGMKSKLEIMYNIVENNPSIKVQIISGRIVDNLFRSLLGDETFGTLIKAN